MAAMGADKGHDPHAFFLARDGHDRCFLDLGVAIDAGLDFAEFDTEAANLDLVIGAAQALHAAVGIDSGEIAGAVAYLASEEARFITGDSLTIDGGQTVS